MRNLLFVLVLALAATLFAPFSARAQAVVTPTVQTFSPQSIVAGTRLIGDPLPVTVTGAGFGSKTTATVSSPTISSRSLEIIPNPSGTQATILVRAPLLKYPTTLTIVLANPPPDKSVSITFAVTYPTPTITSVTPASTAIQKPGLVGVGPAVITVSGSGIGPYSTGVIGLGPTGVAGKVSGSSMVFQMPPAGRDQVIPMTLSGAISNPGQAGSAPFTVTVTNPDPVVLFTDVGGNRSAALVAGGNAVYTVNVSGLGFVPSSKVFYGGQSQKLPTVYKSYSQLSATLPAALLVPTEQIPLGVQNAMDQFSAPTNGFSAVPTAPQLSSISPAAIVKSSGNVQVVLSGTGLYNTTTIRAGTTILTSTPIGVSPVPPLPGLIQTGFVVTIPPRLQTAGTLSLTAVNSDQRVSNAVVLTIKNP
jgi:hypothetical protein